MSVVHSAERWGLSAPFRDGAGSNSSFPAESRPCFSEPRSRSTSWQFRPATVPCRGYQIGKLDVELDHTFDDIGGIRGIQQRPGRKHLHRRHGDRIRSARNVSVDPVWRGPAEADSVQHNDRAGGRRIRRGIDRSVGVDHHWQHIRRHIRALHVEGVRNGAVILHLHANPRQSVQSERDDRVDLRCADVQQRTWDAVKEHLDAGDAGCHQSARVQYRALADPGSEV